jgi:sugar phosphate isomerase/epimerase
MPHRYTRREIAKLALLALPAAGAFSLVNSLRAAEAASAIPAPAGKPNSKVNGVQIGLNVPYSFGNNNLPGDETLARCLQLGVSALELRSQPIEAFMGAPAPAARGGGNRGGAPAGGAAVPAPGGSAPAAAAGGLQAWRLTAPMAKAREFRKIYEDAGVFAEIIKFDGVPTMSDAELDYAFTLAKAVGARAISCEMAVDQAKRVGTVAEKHGMFVGWHNHAAMTSDVWEAAFAEGKFNGANVDIGHFVAGNNKTPADFIRKYHDRVTHIHVKDRKFNNGPNVPFGEGDTPVAEILRMIRDNRWPIQATIEFEYPVPAGSDRMAEIAKCVKFCREALA